jgi:hypothetical protein
MMKYKQAIQYVKAHLPANAILVGQGILKGKCTFNELALYVVIRN